jgi:lactate racemase
LSPKYGPSRSTSDRSGERRPAPRPGLVVDVDRSTPPVLLHHGEQFRLERLPADRSRIIYPPEPLHGLEDPDRAIRDALESPIDSEPLRARLFPGMQLTIAFDDISLPLPKMRRPDIRQRIIEAVLDIAAEVGVDDVHLIAALALHRRMTEAELRYCLGDRIYDAFAPRGQLYNHDAEDPDGMELIGETRHGEEVQISKRAATSDLIVYVNINLVSMDGGWKSTATGLSGYQALRHHHNVATMRATRSFMDQERSELHRSNWRQGEVLRDAGIEIFQIETTVNNDLFGDGPLSVLAKREWEWSPKDRLTFLGVQKGLDAMSTNTRRRVMHSWEAPYALTSVQAGEVEAVHKLTTQHVYDQQLVPVEGQTDVVLYGLPYVGPYNVNSIMNPILVMCLGLGYFFNMYRGRPVVREGGVLIMTHPTTNEFHPVHHPSYIDFFEQVLAETTDPLEIEQRYEQSYATDEWYRHLYRTSYAYHGVHPFYMWYWGSHALEHLGQVIIVGGDPATVRRLGFRPASTLADALEMATDVVGPSPTITYVKNPPLGMADVT